MIRPDRPAFPHRPASQPGCTPALGLRPTSLPRPAVAGHNRASLLAILGAVLLLALLLPACEREVTLIEPPPFFTFDPANAWNCQRDFRGPATVPPPEGLFISVCPNPAPPGTQEIRFDFTLEIQTPGVNLAIVDNRGVIVRELLLGFRAEKDVPQTVRWLLDGVAPGDYRAYLTAGEIETSGDIRVD